MSNYNIYGWMPQMAALLKDKIAASFADYANGIMLKPNTANIGQDTQVLNEALKELKVRSRFDIEREEAEKLKLSKILDRDTLFRFAYVPFVIAELAWDYADTVLTLSAMMKTGAKKLCRAVRELRREYERERARFIDQAHKDSEVENMYVFEDGVKDIYTQMLVNVRCDLNSEYPSLDKDSVDLLTAVYQCDITLQSLILYTQQQTSKIERIVGHRIGKILPAQVYQLARLMPEFVGDKPASERFNKLKKQYEKTFATQIALIELNDTLD